MIRVISRHSLNTDLKKLILQKLEAYFGDGSIKEHEVVFETDKDIICGIKVIKDSLVLDLTFNRRINEIINLIRGQI